jgi:catechol 2,3-dioxygenase-like lactoylglutathione lyase family enzyme
MGGADGIPQSDRIGGVMGLNDGRVGAAIAVTDMARAVEFYEGKLGLRSSGDDPDGGRTYECGGGTTLHVFPSPLARASGATVAGWIVDDVEGTVDEVIANGVTFEQYSDGLFATDEKGLSRIGDRVGAWVKDPDGNVLGIGNR